MVRCVVLVGLTFVLSSTAVYAQTVPPTDPQPAAATRVRTLGETNRETASWLLRFPSILPTTGAFERSDGTAEGAKKYILDFYQRDESFNPADQVQFLYSFGAQKRKGLSADLFALIFPLGVRVALGSSVTAEGEDTEGPPTPEQAVQRIRDGGDMYLTGAYPLFAKSTPAFTTTLFFAPRVNFLFDGFGGTDTVTEATEFTWNIGAEWYLEFPDLQGFGKAFVFARSGRQRVSPAFQAATNLETNQFGVHQVALGFLFADMVRVTAQRFSAPPAAAGLNADQLKGWRLAVQLSPQRKKDDGQ